METNRTTSTERNNKHQNPRWSQSEFVTDRTFTINLQVKIDGGTMLVDFLNAVVVYSYSGARCLLCWGHYRLCNY